MATQEQRYGMSASHHSAIPTVASAEVAPAAAAPIAVACLPVLLGATDTPGPIFSSFCSDGNGARLKGLRTEQQHEHRRIRVTATHTHHQICTVPRTNDTSSSKDRKRTCSGSQQAFPLCAIAHCTLKNARDSVSMPLMTHRPQLLQPHRPVLPPTHLRSSSFVDAPPARPSHAKAKVVSPLPASPGLSARAGTPQTSRAKSPSARVVDGSVPSSRDSSCTRPSQSHEARELRISSRSTGQQRDQQ